MYLNVFLLNVNVNPIKSDSKQIYNVTKDLYFNTKMYSVLNPLIWFKVIVHPKMKILSLKEHSTFFENRLIFQIPES